MRTLVETWSRMGAAAPPLKIVGDGPLQKDVQELAARVPGVDWVGLRSHAEVVALMRRAKVLVFPSLCYEGFGMVIAEAFATGLPPVVSRLSMACFSNLQLARLTGPLRCTAPIINSAMWLGVRCSTRLRAAARIRARPAGGLWSAQSSARSISPGASVE